MEEFTFKAKTRSIFLINNGLRQYDIEVDYAQNSLSMIERFQNLMHNFVQSSLIQMFHQSFLNFNNALNSQFVVKCIIDLQNTVILQPQEKQLTISFHQILYDALYLIDQINQEYKSQFNVKRQGWNPSLFLEIQKRWRWQQNIQNLNDKIKSDYIKTQIIQEKVILCLIVANDRKEFEHPNQREEYKKQFFEISKVMSEILIYVDWQQLLQNQLKDSQKGFIYLNNQQLKGQLTDHVMFKLDFFKNYLYDYMSTLAKRTCNSLDEFDLSLSNYPIELKDFKPYYQKIHKIKSEIKDITFQKQEVESCHQLFKKIDLSKLKYTDFDNLLKIQSDFNELNTNIQKSEQYVESKKEQNTKKFLKIYKDLEKSVASTINLIDSNVLVIDQSVETVQEALQNISEVNHLLQNIQEKILNITNQYNNLQDYIKTLNGIFQPIDAIEILDQKFKDRKSIWNQLEILNKVSEQWLRQNIFDLNVNDMQDLIDSFVFTKNTLKLRVKSLNKSGNDRVLSIFCEQLAILLEQTPLILSLGNPDMKQRHLKQIFLNLNTNQVPEYINYQQLLQLGGGQIKDLIEEISQRATGEELIQVQLNLIVQKWNSMIFEFIPLQIQQCYRIVHIDEILQILDDHEMSLQAFLGTRFVSFIKDDVEIWLKKIRIIQSNITEWMVCQRNWLYLENIFQSKDLQIQQDQEYRVFRQVDKFLRVQSLMAYKNPLIIQQCGNIEIFQKLFKCNQQLNQILAKLDIYLQEIRKKFPRLYVLSNDELFQLLAEIKKMSDIQPHLKKLFDNMNKIKFLNDQQSEIIGIYSYDPQQEPEYVQFNSKIKIDQMDRIENKLKILEDGMIQNLKLHSLACLKNIPSNFQNRKDWFLGNYPAQCIILIEHIQWQNKLTQTLILQGQISNLYTEYKDIVLQLVDTVRNYLQISQRMLICTLLIINVHLRDILQQLKDFNIQITSFDFLKQLRYYFINNQFVIQQTSFQIPYCFEYLGISQRLVITPLTDHCYMTLTTALRFSLGGLSQGPAGTGKTETIRDLARCVANFCVVFNCSENVDFKLLKNYFLGACEQGMWTCFDEFNRISIEVLSVVVKTLVSIQNSLREKQLFTFFDGTSTKLDHKVGIFITMNPSYVGRQQLPDNLKALFRPVTMMIPDYDLISEIILLSYGFKQAKNLSSKIVTVFKLASQLLSYQIHYDFGMRALKSVLTLAGFYNILGELRRCQDLTEEIIIIQALQLSQLPKFVAYDLNLFKNLMEDLFQQQIFDQKLNKNLQNIAIKYLESLNYVYPIQFLQKLEDLDQLINQRNGIIIIGPTKSGKSTLYKTLLQNFDQTHQTLFVNPGSQSLENLFGQVNLITNEWEKGLISVSLDYNHLYLDGPVLSFWVENLNTCLDDNKILCLSNGQRIKLKDEFKLIFETDSLEQASPATVSRCAIIYLNSNILGWKSLINSFHLEIEDKNWKTVLYKRLQNIIPYLENCLKITDQNQNIMINMPSTLISNYLNLVRIFLKDSIDQIGSDILFMMIQNDIETIINMVLALALVWSFGVNIFDKFNRKNRQLIDLHLKAQIVKFSNIFPLDGNIFDYFIDYKKKCFKSWQEAIPQQKIYNMEDFNEIYVPTVESEKFSFIISKILQNNLKPLVCGEQSSGKTSVILNTLKNFQGQDYYHISFNSKTTFQYLKDIYHNKLKFSHKQKEEINPLKKSLIIFIDDISLPEKGFNSPFELLRLLVSDHPNFKSSKKTVLLKNFNYIGAYSINQNNLEERLISKFQLIYMADISRKSVISIFKQILQRGFQDCSIVKELQLIIGQIVECQVDFIDKVSNVFKSMPSNPHYNFGFKHIQKVFQGMLKVYIPSIDNKQQAIFLWIHEIMRNVYDCLSNSDDKEQMRLIFSKEYERIFQADLQLNSFNYKFTQLQTSNLQYQFCENIDDLSQILNDHQDNLRIQYDCKKLIFFKDAIFQIIQTVRILALPQSHQLALGMKGLGRRSIGILTAFILNMQRVELNNNCKMEQWRNETKEVIKAVGTGQKKIVWIIQQRQIRSEIALEELLQFLKYGFIENFFTVEETEEIFNLLKQSVKEKWILNDKDLLMDVFKKRVKYNLHLIICLSPTDELFRQRIKNFPILVQDFTINWIQNWPEEALISIARQQFLSLDASLYENFKKTLPQLCASLHILSLNLPKPCQNTPSLSTPTFYLSFLSLFVSLFSVYSSILPKTINKYSQGINQIEQTRNAIQKLKANLEFYEPQADQAYKENIEIKQILGVKLKEMQDIRNIMDQESQILQIQKEEMMKTKQNHFIENEQSRLTLEKCHQEVMSIDKYQLKIIKSYIKPPFLIQLVMESVCLLFGFEETWENAKKHVLNDMKFLEKLIEYDVDNKEEIFNKFRKKYLVNSDFEYQKVTNQSQSAGQIFSWLIAINDYQKIKKQSDIKVKKLNETLETLLNVEKQLSDKNRQLNETIEFCDQLQFKFTESSIKSEQLKQKITKTREQLDRSSKLILLLSDESSRWSVNLEEVKNKFNNIIGNIVLSCALITYLAPYDNETRMKYIHRWRDIIRSNLFSVDENFRVEKILISEHQLQYLHQKGLPTDQQSIENSIIIQQSQKYSLIMDPQNQAFTYLNNLYAQDVQTTQANYSQFLRILINCVQYGQPLILQGVDQDLDSQIEPLVQKQITRKGTQFTVIIGEKEISYNKNFKLFLITRNTNPKFSPELCSIVTLINFSLTQTGLEEQLLSELIILERNELEVTKLELINQLLVDKIKLEEIENLILNEIELHKHDFLENDVLLNVVQQSQQIFKQVSERVQISEKTKSEILETRNNYKKVVVRASIIYFSILDMSKIDNFYQFSLDLFLMNFKDIIKSSEKSDNLYQRLQTLRDNITLKIFNQFTQGIFSKDKLLFSFILTLRIQDQVQPISQQEQGKFLKNSQIDLTQLLQEKPSFLSQQQFEELLQLEQISSNFVNLLNFFEQQPILFKQILIKPYSTQLSLKLSDFQKLLIYQAILPNNTIQHIINFIKQINIIDISKIDLSQFEDQFQNMSNNVPLIYLNCTSQEQINIQFEHKNIILPDGQDTIKQTIKSMTSIGGVLVLQDCHLSITWINELSNIIEEFKLMKIDQKFRLILMTKSINQFPSYIILNSLKYIKEPPKSFKQNLSQLYSEVQLDDYNQLTNQQKKLLFNLSIFHTLITQRKRYGSIGWTEIYEWMSTDFDTSNKIIQVIIFNKQHLNENNKPQMDYLLTMISQIIYGGRVTDLKDKILIKNLINYTFENQSDIYQDYFKLSDYSLNSINNLIQSIDYQDPPQYFGLHYNASISQSRKEAKAFFESMQIIELNNKQKSNDIQIKNILRNIQSNLIGYLQEIMIKSDTLDVILNFKNFEIVKFNSLIKLISQSLQQLKLFFQGKIDINEKIEKMQINFRINQVPQIWQDISYLSEKPLSSWINDFKQRIDFFKQWNQFDKIQLYQLSSFFYPQGFITCIKQSYSKHHQIHLDLIEIDYLIQNFDNQPDQIQDQFHIQGLIMQGSEISIDDLLLIDCINKDTYFNLPIITLIPVHTDLLQINNRYACPLYKTVARKNDQSSNSQSNNYIMDILLSSIQNTDYWIKKGVAIFCQTDL